ncbi:ABC transporter ATP-binding protein [Variovorax sp. VNK109]|uniref:ABC transporter ATP-binding protein n=1 Tax=Variovorax sp. VNK109 TaxID=3400919 RepID=UPI003C053152
MTPRLSIENLSVTYASARGRLTAVRDLNLQVADGEFVAVLGPSGCGKSTLLNIASGLLKPSSGKVQIQGQPVAGPRRDVGIVFQQPTLLPWKTVLQNVLVPVEAMGLRVEDHMDRARALIRLVRLEGFEGHYPNELSGGMQQRVGIARGFMHDPQLLLMDEPFAALDAMTREHMSDELQDMWRQSGKSVLFITHSIPEAVYLADRVVVLSERPGTVVDVIDVPLPRPRTIATLGSAEFNAICNRLRLFFRTPAPGKGEPE